MGRNIGTLDQILRTGHRHGAGGDVDLRPAGLVGILGFYPLVTGITGVCPIYPLLGVSTRRPAAAPLGGPMTEGPAGPPA